MATFFKMIPRPSGDALVVRYRCEVWHRPPVPYTLDGRTFSATRCVELGLLPDSVEVICQYHLTGEGVPREPSGRSVTPEETLARQSHADFLADRSPITAAGAPWFDAADWPSILDEAARLLERSREEGRWRRNLEVPVTAAQVDEALKRLRAGKVLQAASPYTDHRFRWDAERETFTEHSSTTNPYSGEERRSISPISDARMREVLEGIPGERLAKLLR